MDYEQEQDYETDEFESKLNTKKILIIVFSILIFLICILICLKIHFSFSPIEKENIYCSYMPEYNKIRCIQLGDVVPDWLEVDDSYFEKDLYSMKLIFTQSQEDYITMDMTDRVFIEDLARKFIYEKNEQTLKDYVNFKKFVKNSKISNFGSLVLFCSESHLDDSICKRMKRNHK